MSAERPLDAERLTRDLDGLAARTGFSGVVRVDGPRGPVVEVAYGQAHRGYGIANDVGTRVAIASGTKSYTGLAVGSLVDGGTALLSTTARSLSERTSAHRGYVPSSSLAPVRVALPRRLLRVRFVVAFPVAAVSAGTAGRSPGLPTRGSVALQDGPPLVVPA